MNNLYTSLPWRTGNITCRSLTSVKCRLLIVTYFQRVCYQWERGIAFQWRNLTNMTSVRSSRSPSTVVDRVDGRYTWYDMTSMILYLWCHFCQDLWLQSNNEKNSDDEASGKTPEQYSSKQSGSSKLQSLRNWHTQKGTKKIWQSKEVWYPKQEPRTRKRHWVKTREIWMNCGL